jgi:hypothetical protein
MHNLTTLIIICFLALSCKKESYVVKIQDIYVEETLRLDTMDFSINNRVDATGFYFELKATPFNDSLYTYPIRNAALYDCKILGNRIEVKSLFSSSNLYQNLSFFLEANKNSFIIDKFYIRSSLPNSLKFVKL